MESINTDSLGEVTTGNIARLAESRIEYVPDVWHVADALELPVRDDLSYDRDWAVVAPYECGVIVQFYRSDVTVYVPTDDWDAVIAEFNNDCAGHVPIEDAATAIINTGLNAVWALAPASASTFDNPSERTVRNLVAAAIFLTNWPAEDVEDQFSVWLDNHHTRG